MEIMIVSVLSLGLSKAIAMLAWRSSHHATGRRPLSCLEVFLTQSQQVVTGDTSQLEQHLMLTAMLVISFFLLALAWIKLHSVWGLAAFEECQVSSTVKHLLHVSQVLTVRTHSPLPSGTAVSHAHRYSAALKVSAAADTLGMLGWREWTCGVSWEAHCVLVAS